MIEIKDDTVIFIFTINDNHCSIIANRHAMFFAMMLNIPF